MPTNDVMDCNVYNDSATYIAHQIRITPEAEKPKAVQSNDKRPVIWGKLKTALFQNYPNPFNPEDMDPVSTIARNTGADQNL